MKITSIKGREIFDCRGFPALECQLILENSIPVIASVPTGVSKGSHEAFELRDGSSKFNGYGVQKAIEKLETIIEPALIDKVPDLIAMDQQMIQLDGTDNKSSLGANTMLAASIAIIRAQAIMEQCELYELIAQLCGAQTVTLPFPMFVMLSGGMHANNNLRIQEFLILPIGAQNFKDAMEHSIIFFHALKKALFDNKMIILTNDEGSFAPNFKDDTEALNFLVKIMEQLSPNYHFKIALDVAASHFFDAATHRYNWHGTMYEANELIAWYTKLVSQYPIYSLEDPLSQDDWEGWNALMEILGEEIQIIGDDLFATDPVRIWHGIETQAANAALIKPNQIGTITETLQAIQLCQQYGLNVAVSHRAGETNDTFIADLAVGTSAGQIKAGSCCRGERLAKYNRLLAIEDNLTLSLLDI